MQDLGFIFFLFSSMTILGLLILAFGRPVNR